MFGCQTWQVLSYLSPTYTILPDNSATKQEINEKCNKKNKWIPEQNKTLKTVAPIKTKAVHSAAQEGLLLWSSQSFAHCKYIGLNFFTTSLHAFTK